MMSLKPRLQIKLAQIRRFDEGEVVKVRGRREAVNSGEYVILAVYYTESESGEGYALIVPSEYCRFTPDEWRWDFRAIIERHLPWIEQIAVGRLKRLDIPARHSRAR